jgi:DNA repair protein RadC
VCQAWESTAAKALVTHFGSIASLKEATVDQITAVAGIGVATASAVPEAQRPIHLLHPRPPELDE